jgi:hypothetical protein
MVHGSVLTLMTDPMQNSRLNVANNAHELSGRLAFRTAFGCINFSSSLI